MLNSSELASSLVYCHGFVPPACVQLPEPPSKSSEKTFDHSG